MAEAEEMRWGEKGQAAPARPKDRREPQKQAAAEEIQGGKKNESWVVD